MVRDEIGVLERCLASVIPHIDSWVIMDTGSVDGTPELIERLLQGIPGRLIYEPWRDFGTNRTLLMKAARRQARHLLLIDADMELTVDGDGGELRDLRGPAYALRHLGKLRYDVVRVVDGRKRWSFVGATHEALIGPLPLDDAPVLKHVKVVHHADGSQRTHKLRRDRDLLETAVRRDPHDRRSTFYLAQTYRDLDDRDRAEALYRRRADDSSDDEEAFYAAFQAATLRGRHDPVGGLGELLLAWNRRPSRAEPLHAAAQLARRNGWTSVGLTMAEMGMGLDEPDDRLFVHTDVYRWAMRAERGFARMNSGNAAGALADFDAALADTDIDAAVRAEIEAVRWRCLPPDHPSVEEAGTDPLLEEITPGVAYAELAFEGIPDWPRFNPSITSDGQGGYVVVVRSANYELLEPGHRMLDNTHETRTVNHLLTLSHELEILSAHQLVDRTGRTRFPTEIRGFEDCRLMIVDGQLHAIACVRDNDPDGWWTMALLRLDGHDIVSMEPLVSPVGRVPEKNWVPFECDGALHLVYKWQPLTILDRTGAVRYRAEQRSASSWRGGTQGIPWRDGWLFIVHEVEQSNRRRYRHRFVELRPDWTTNESIAFSFTGHRIEFAAGLSEHDDHLLVTLGVGDRIPVLARLPHESVARLLGTSAGG